ncbi:hypothetical protein [Streptococcus pseudoporcinus]|uniref:Membrane protein n=1 Tax=Streptococcus pseudoporcinus TaxID=361101 RepID=A0A4U9XGT7_9STRE|nr:hypothetical protein [Streptococcus pseudoporcinus]VTS12344.1 membrane protein [Streptococcus pseudoporcinus]VUC64870.1 membrane protein [Streptococcus pseudoporcinus]VUC95344.1 membrane protein [Streptococcus pseudoporcinus]VUC95707.1 membrane protein [Streptococcus pseudoporcinus]
MINHFIKSVTKEKSMAEFTKVYRRRAILAILLALVLGFLSLRISFSSYTKGFVLGMSLALFVLAIRKYMVLHDERRLKAIYIKSKDERQGLILLISSALTLALQVMFIIAFLCLNAFFEITFDFRLLLICDLYLLIISLFGMEMLLQRMM